MMVSPASRVIVGFAPPIWPRATDTDWEKLLNLRNCAEQGGHMHLETLHNEVKYAAASLILSRPARSNALNARMLEELNVAMDRAEADERVRVVVVTGAGAAFSSGFDLKEQMERQPSGFEQ